MNSSEEPKPNTTKSLSLPDYLGLDELLANAPLYSEKIVTSLYKERAGGSELLLADVDLHCEDCKGVRTFTPQAEERLIVNSIRYHYVVFTCRNCQNGRKIFGLKSERIATQSREGACTKIYEEPSFGVPIPPKFFELIGEANRDTFLQGRRALLRGLGIGAYAYYRRIVEDQKNSLIDIILKVAQRTSAPPEQISNLKEAQDEQQFSKAVEILKDLKALPASLLINGHNPLLLLHDALSEGIHGLSDAECLGRSQEAETILFELAERIQIALSERKAVDDALKGIMARRKSKK